MLFSFLKKIIVGIFESAGNLLSANALESSFMFVESYTVCLAVPLKVMVSLQRKTEMCREQLQLL